jgi:alkylation response protein AidB-like acyl-CoA dehydrogenase
VDLITSPEHMMLVASGREFVRRECPTSRVRAIAQGSTGFDRELWDQMADLGWPGLAIAEEHGGAGGGMLDLVLLCEALGRGPVPSPLVVSTTLVAVPISRLGTDAQRARWLPALASGAAIGTMAILEPDHRHEWSPARVTGGTRLRGQKVAVPWAGIANVLIVRADDGLYLVEPDAATVVIERHHDLGVEPLVAVELRDAPAERLGGRIADGGERGRSSADRHDAAFRRSIDCAAVAQLAYAVGAAEQALEMAIDHARDRRQFGRPIGSFQAVAHRCVDMRTDIDACRYLTYRAGWALDRGQTSELEVASALAYGTEALRRIVVHAHQVHGAIGFSTEHDLHLYTRAAKASELQYGSASRHLESVAAVMGLA